MATGEAIAVVARMAIMAVIVIFILKKSRYFDLNIYGWKEAESFGLGCFSVKEIDLCEN